MRQRERRRGAVLAALFIGLLAIGAATAGMSVRSAAETDQTYEKLKVFTDVLGYVQKQYVQTVDTEKLIHGAIQGMLETLDPHSSFLPPEVYKEIQQETEGSFGGLGLEITLKEGLLTVVSPIEDTPAFRAGIQPGDRIVKVEGESTKKMSLYEAVKRMRGKPGTEVTISIVREGWEEPKDFKIERAVINVKSVKWKLLEPGYGYLRVTQFSSKTADEVDAALDKLEKDEKLKGLVLDLRNDPGGLLDQAVKVAEKFIASGLIVYTDGRVPSQRMKFSASGQDSRGDFQMVALINSGSASASEIVAGALQDHKRALILGTRSFGKGSVQTLIPLDDNRSGLRLTTALYFTPNGRSIQAKGIEPDIVVQESLAAELNPSRRRRHIREADLEGHFHNGGAEKPEGDEAKPPAADEERPDGKTEPQDGEEDGPGQDDLEETQGVKFGEEGDLQLERAIELLKSWQIFQGGGLVQQAQATEPMGAQDQP